MNPAQKAALPARIFDLISTRPAGLCNFLDAPNLPLSGQSRRGPISANKNAEWEQETRVVYRCYATLYFVFVVDGSESELGVLDLIQVRPFRIPVRTSINSLADRFNTTRFSGLCRIPRSRLRECL